MHKKRRLCLNLNVLYKLLTENIDCTNDILGSLSFSASARTTQSKNVFRLNFLDANYASNITCNRMIKSINVLEIDTFISPNVFSFKMYCNSVFS